MGDLTLVNTSKYFVIRADSFLTEESAQPASPGRRMTSASNMAKLKKLEEQERENGVRRKFEEKYNIKL